MLSRNNGNQTYIDPSSAIQYHQGNTVQFYQASKFIDENGSLIKGPVLDVGCGDGAVTAYIGKIISVPIIGMDISQDRVNLANELYKNSNLQFVSGNAIHLSENTGLIYKKFSTIVSFNTLHHIPKDKQFTVFSQVKTLLNENGVALLLVPGRTPMMHDSITQTASSDKWKEYFSDFNLENVRTYEDDEYYRELSIKAGFSDIDVKSSIEDGGNELNFEETKTHLKGWLPHLAHLKQNNVPEQIQNELLNDIVACFFSKNSKSTSATVRLTVTQNKIKLSTCHSSLFNKNELKDNIKLEDIPKKENPSMMSKY